MRQFSINVEDGLLLAAKQHAVRTGRTVSDLVCELLAREVGWKGSGKEQAIEGTAALPVLRSYSEGRIARRKAMEALGLPPERQADFVEAMNRLAVAWPTPDAEQIAREADVVVQAIQEAARKD